MNLLLSRMEEKTEQPLPQPSFFSGHLAVVASSDEDPMILSEHLHIRARRRLLLCGLCTTILLLTGVAAIVLAFTVFRVQNPTLTMNRIIINRIRVVGNGSAAIPLSVNATLVADISVRNPNIAALHFGKSVTEYYMEGSAVGSGWGPGSRVPGKETARMNVTGQVVADRIVVWVGRVSDSVSGILRVRSRTEVMGRVNVLGVFRRNVGVTLGCTMSLDSNRSVEVAGTRDCTSNVK